MKIQKLLMSFILMVFLSACGLDDYADMDRDGGKFNCAELINYEGYVHDFEAKSNYTFTQCRAEIQTEKKARCDGIIDYYIGGWHGYRTQEKDVYACSIEIEKFMEEYNNDFEISGKTLKANGMVIHKQGMVIKKIRQRKVFLEKVIFHFTIEQGDTRVQLEFNSRNNAQIAHNQIADYLAL